MDGSAPATKGPFCETESGTKALIRIGRRPSSPEVKLDGWPGLRPQGRDFPRQKTSSPQECQRTQTRVRQGRRAPAPRSVTGRACWRMPGLKNTVACQSSCWCPPVLGLVARQFLGWCPQVYGSATLRNVPVRLFSRVGILRCRVAHSTVVCVATATRQNDNKMHVSSGFTKQLLGPTTSHGKIFKKKKHISLLSQTTRYRQTEDHPATHKTCF